MCINQLVCSLLAVFTDFENKQGWKQCFSVAGVYLPTGYYIGMSAATGDLSDNHDVIGVRLYELENSAVSIIVIRVVLFHFDKMAK